MSKRSPANSLPGKENKRKKETRPDNQRKLDTFFRQRAHPDLTAADIMSPGSKDLRPRINTGSSEENNSPVSSGSSFTSANSLDIQTDSESGQGHDSPSSIVDANSPAQIKPFFATSMYTDEFVKIMDVVLDGEKYLFANEELEIIEKCKRLPTEAKHLFVRLFLRKHRWTRLKDLDYSRNISDINAAKEELCDQQYELAHDENVFCELELAQLLGNLRVPELKSLIHDLRIPYVKNSLQNRTDLVTCILDYAAGRPCPLKDQAQKVLRFVNSTSSVDTPKDLQARNDGLINAIRTLLGQISLHYLECKRQNNIRENALYLLPRIWSINFWPDREHLLEYYEAVNVFKQFTTTLEDLYAGRKDGRAQNEEQWKVKEAATLAEAWSLCENILSKWQEIINQKSMASQVEDWDEPRLYFRKRFESGWVYTHMIEDGAGALGKLKQYEKEAMILKMLLEQNIYRLGKRGAWYDRLALIQMYHFRTGKRRLHQKAALETCIKAIRDPKVHLIYLSSLQNRIIRLESMLNVPKREQHDFFYNTLTTATERVIYGERLSDPVTGYKSVFRNNDGGECSVEELSLGYYQKAGYTGFHSENGIITTIFGLLFWDILFAPFPDVLETPFQNAPLDLKTDAFFVGRSFEIYARLRDISNGKAVEILKQVDERERSSSTSCIGVSWSYTFEQLSQICECIGPHALSQICKLFAEEYGHRTGGIPDLCCWNYEKKECLFVEGPGDILSDTQKVTSATSLIINNLSGLLTNIFSQLWIDVLINCGVPVELCHVKVWEGEDQLLKVDSD
ncbi:hypothetical protein INT43_006172 [Umbelopsis isabellina]|uniref:Fanconi-associated nuclease n=1 Tax=Mortierella isabellina TaxID=91625 RepID=A0A8H7PZ94_MORIS|nr:hypothetical protein INT43_006172 [Umbelopsis isabellina]